MGRLRRMRAHGCDGHAASPKAAAHFRYTPRLADPRPTDDVDVLANATAGTAPCAEKYRELLLAADQFWREGRDAHTRVCGRCLGTSETRAGSGLVGSISVVRRTMGEDQIANHVWGSRSA